ncbi:hypothetical protein [Azotobacter vinelandii]
MPGEAATLIDANLAQLDRAQGREELAYATGFAVGAALALETVGLLSATACEAATRAAKDAADTGALPGIPHGSMPGWRFLLAPATPRPTKACFSVWPMPVPRRNAASSGMPHGPRRQTMTSNPEVLFRDALQSVFGPLAASASCTAGG